MKLEKEKIVKSNVNINYGLWEKYKKTLKELKEECDNVKINIGDKSSPRAEEHKKYDAWGCLWHYPGNYLDGQVIEHPLEDWGNFKNWQPPDPKVKIKKFKEEKQKNLYLEHGFLFLRLTYLRGFENFMIDVAKENSKIFQLRDIVTKYWHKVIKYGLKNGVNFVRGGDDLGMQNRLPISPKSWRKLIKPAYKQIFGLAKNYNATTYLHSDGYIVDIIPDLIEIGIDILNPQDLVNGLDNLKKIAKGKVKIDLDIDRQKITVFSGKKKINQHIKKCIKMLGSSQGGLSLNYGVYPGTPVQNIVSVIQAMEKYSNYWV